MTFTFYLFRFQNNLTIFRQNWTDWIGYYKISKNENSLVIKDFFCDLNITLFKRKGELPKHKIGFTSGNPVVSKAPLNRLRWKNNQPNNINVAARIQLSIAIFETDLALFDATTFTTTLHKCALSYLKLL